MKLLARLVAVAGAVAVGAYLLGAAPRDLTLVYDVPEPGAGVMLEIEIRRGPEVVRRSELAVPPEGGQVRHPVRLRDGEYVLAWSLGGSSPAHGVLPLEVREDGTVVLSLRR